MSVSKYERRIEDLKRFIQKRDEIVEEGGNRCTITLQVTFMEMNLLELPALVKLAISLGIDRVKGHHLWVNFPELKSQDLRRSPDSIERWNAIMRQCKRIARKNPAPGGKFIKLENFTELTISKANSDEGYCPFLGKEAWINTEGTFSPCCAPDEERKRLGYFGNVTESGLRKLWQSKEYTLLTTRQPPGTICLKCNMKSLEKRARSQSMTEGA